MHHRVAPAILAVLLSACAGNAGVPTADVAPTEPGHGAHADARGRAIGQALIVRTTENVRDDAWVWLLDRADEAGIERIDLLLKQDEPHFTSDATGQTIDSGELLVALPGEQTAAGWEESGWLEELIDRAHGMGIEVWAWWPTFQDARMAARWPEHAYPMPKGQVFVDLAVPEVQARQAELLEKLLENYALDGVSLDWLRYGAWEHGGNGPLAAEFESTFDRPWEPAILDNEYLKARWFELRSRALERWLTSLVSKWRLRDPTVRWGAYVLPWQFAEVSQDYRGLGRVGLDYLQPMAYWADWGLTPTWATEHLLPRGRLAAPTTAIWPAIDIDRPDAELNEALSGIRPDRLAGISWFVYGAWGDDEFRRLARLRYPGWVTGLPVATTGGRAVVATTGAGSATATTAGATTVTASRETMPVVPQEFDETAAVWNIVALAELYRRAAVDDQGIAPLVPVLALHGFTDGPSGSGATPWTTSTAYLDALLGCIDRAGYHPIAFSQLQAYLIAGDPGLLPPRPLVISLDDASASVADLFYPRARRLELPFLVSVVTSWPPNAGEAEGAESIQAHDGPTLTWDALRAINAGGLAEFASHSDDLHRYAPAGPGGTTSEPALAARAFDPAHGVTETEPEHVDRVYADLLTSRVRLYSEMGGAPTVLNWPYGVHDAAGVQAARAAGFTHFLLYGGNRLATYAADGEFVPRLSVTRVDESLPLEFPSEEVEAQRWWLAFLRTAWSSRSVALLDATLAQLGPDAARHPRAEVARAAITWLQGDSSAARRSLTRLRETYPDDAGAIRDADELEALYRDVDG